MTSITTISTASSISPDSNMQLDGECSGTTRGSDVVRVVCTYCPRSRPACASLPRPEPRCLASSPTLQNNGRSATPEPHLTSLCPRDWVRMTTNPREFILEELTYKIWVRPTPWSLPAPRFMSSWGSWELGHSLSKTLPSTLGTVWSQSPPHNRTVIQHGCFSQVSAIQSYHSRSVNYIFQVWCN